MMDVSNQPRGRGGLKGGRPHSRNKRWVSGQDHANHGNDGERWERGGHRKPYGGRGSHSGRSTPHLTFPQNHEDPTSGEEEGAETDVEVMEDNSVEEEELPLSATQAQRETFYQHLVKAREQERLKAIAEGKMDSGEARDLSQAITMKGTCQDMCPRFERYRRERENNLDKWEMVPGTKRVDHKRAVKKYERGAGDKIIPSDLRPPEVLKKTLDYLFHDLIEKGGFSETYAFIRDRSRQVRVEFSIQQEIGPIAIECHDRCARFHILALHLERKNPAFSVQMEHQQLSYTLISLLQFYDDMRADYSSPTELEMRVYHRLIQMRDQRERVEHVPDAIKNHPVFKLTTRFRARVQIISSPITKTSSLKLDAGCMEIFAELATVLRQQNNVVMIYLVACLLEFLFGEDAIDNIEAIRGDLTIPEIIDGISRPLPPTNGTPSAVPETSSRDGVSTPFGQPNTFVPPPPVISPTETNPQSSVFGASQPVSSQPTPIPIKQSAFSNLTTQPNVFGTTNVFGGGSVFSSGSSPFGKPPTSVFGAGSSFPSSSNESAAATAPPTFSTTSPVRTRSLADAPPLPDMQNTPSPYSTSHLSHSITDSKVPKSIFPMSTPVPSAPSTHQQGLLNIFNGSPSTHQPSASNTATFPTPHDSPLNPQAVPFAPFPSAPTFFSPPTAPPIFTAPAPIQPSDFTSSIAPTAAKPTLARLTPPTFPAVLDSAKKETTAAQPPQQPAPPKRRIIERSQTLWEIPSTSSTSSPQAKSPPEPHTPTNLTSSSSFQFPISPREPPPLKHENLALPPTPTARWFDPSSIPVPKPGDSLALRKQSLLSLQLTSPTPEEILSPLQLPSPGISRLPTTTESPTPTGKPGAPFPSPLRSTTKADASFPTLEIKSGVKGKGKETAVDLEKRAVTFVRTSLLVKTSFEKWLQKTMDRAAYEEAVRRSEAYQDEIRRGERLRESVNGLNHSKRESSLGKRRVSDEITEPVRKKRTRRRESQGYQVPLTDEQLVQRLKENKEENEKRWATGSFMTTIQQTLQARLQGRQFPPGWSIWLSLNSDNDGTAIWLERKFDVPNSGEWLSENVFSIPVSGHQTSATESPGLIFFECTPLDAFDDPIERKYRVLDDCARLRDVITEFDRNKEQRYLPVLLTVKWSDHDEDDTEDFTSMLSQLVEEGLVKSVYTFKISSTAKDLDAKFQDSVKDINFDVEDRTAQSMSWQALTNTFVEIFRSAAEDWLYGCWIDEQFNWSRYGEVLRAMTTAEREVALQIVSLVSTSIVNLRVVLPDDLQPPSHPDIDFATGPFLEAHVDAIIQSCARALGSDFSDSYSIPKNQLSRAVFTITTKIQSISGELRELAATAAMNTPPKRPAEDDTDVISPSISSKRLKPTLSMSTNDDSAMEDIQTNGTSTSVSPPPSTYASTVGMNDTPSKPKVTIAMLRALARDVLKNHP